MIRLTICVFLAVFGVMGLVPLGALDSSSLEGAWYRYLPDQSRQFPNGHYRLELIAIYPSSSRAGRMVQVQIYPDARTRTFMRMGTYSDREGAGGSLDVRFAQTRKALAMLKVQPEGFPVSTWLDIKGMTDLAAEESINLVPVYKDGMVDSIKSGSRVFRNLARDLRQYAQGGTPKDAREFMRLLFVHIYAAECRVKDFGTIAMVGMDMMLPGQGSGNLHIQFQSRGFLGLGNSGVMFYIKDASEFPGLLLEGEIFGGVYRMEGIMRLYMVEGGGSVYLGAMDCTGVKLKDGTCSEGDFLVELAANPGAWIPVPWYSIAQ